MELDDVKASNILEGMEKLTKRSITSFVAGQYDPMGSLAPLTLIGKLLLRSLHGKEVNLDWDDALPLDKAKEWGAYIRKMIAMDAVTFPRAVQREHGMGV